MSKANIPKMIELARAHVESEGIRAAEVYYRHILKATETLETPIDRMAAGEANAFFAARAIADGRHGAACDFYQRAVYADPLFVDYRLNFIIRALLPMNMFKNAKIEARRITEIEPDNPDGWRALAICCAALNEADEAATAYDHQLELDPHNPLAKIDRSTLAINVGDYVTARRMAEAVLTTKHAGEGIHTLGLIAYREGRHEDAIELYGEALAVGVQDPEQIKWNMSLACCAIGRYEEGFELAEARGRQQADQAMRLVMNRFNQPALTRETLYEPCRVHVHHEMGNGDAIAMARYFDLLVDIGHDVTLETMKPFVTLFQRSFPRVKVIPRAIDYPGAIGIPPFDRQITTLSLPYLFGTAVDTVPWRGAYLKPDLNQTKTFRRALEIFTSTLPNARKIGLCWSSGIRTDGLWISRYGKQKSMHFDDLKLMLGADSVAEDWFVSLQIGPEREQHQDCLIDPLSENPTWDGTAALIANLDLVITVDTAVAHLAGAMGKPTYLMMQADGASWHFMCERPGAVWNTRSPWYPSIRIFRQKTPGDWGSVVAQIARELTKPVAQAAE
jgi:tetratricopeptide (TPR) repeat protein